MQTQHSKNKLIKRHGTEKNKLKDSNNEANESAMTLENELQTIAIEKNELATQL